MTAEQPAQEWWETEEWLAFQEVYEAPHTEESWEIYDQMGEHGLPCVFSLELLDDNLWALMPNLPVSHDIPREARRSRLHISICKVSDGVWQERIDAIREEWHGRCHLLRGWRKGASFYIAPDDPVAQCPYIWAAHERGCYAGIELHISM